MKTIMVATHELKYILKLLSLLRSHVKNLKSIVALTHSPSFRGLDKITSDVTIDRNQAAYHGLTSPR